MARVSSDGFIPRLQSWGFSCLPCNEQTPDDDRRTVLKTLAATGLAGAGIAGASGSASANPGGGGNPGQGNGNPGQGNGNVPRLTFDLDERGEEFVDEGDDAENIPNGFSAGDDATFDGELILEDLEIAEVDGDEHLLASGRLRGTLSSNPTEQVNETFDGLDLGGLLDGVLELLSPEEAGECPVLDLEIEPIFLDLLGLELETETIDLDLTAVAGEGNLVGNLLCAVAGLLDP
ncbi:hypothetical protein [Natronococcus roseus]|uniref:hypothetical protein n=1 Tax=Natronococcus roseus TaxID=1052014 RepID=UPI00374D1A6F